MNFLSKKYFIVFVFIAVPSLSLAYSAMAPVSGIETTTPASYIGSLYEWGIGIVGVLAFARLVQGGIIYMVSGAVDQKGKAKEIITDALIGLVLALSSALILNIINPQIAEIKNPYTKGKTFCSSSETTPEKITNYQNAGYTCGATSVDEPCTILWTCCPSGTSLTPTAANDGYTCL